MSNFKIVFNQPLEPQVAPVNTIMLLVRLILVCNVKLTIGCGNENYINFVHNKETLILQIHERTSMLFVRKYNYFIQRRKHSSELKRCFFLWLLQLYIHKNSITTKNLLSVVLIKNVVNVGNTCNYPLCFLLDWQRC